MVKISKKELYLRRSVNDDFRDIGADYLNKMVLYGYIDGLESGILVQDTGLLTEINEFIKYDDIISINALDISSLATATIGVLAGGIVTGIVSANYNTDYKSVKIKHKDGTIKITQVRKEDAIKFLGEIKKKINENKLEVTNKTSPIDEIEKAKFLLDDGAINEEEYLIIKKNILKKL